jgi:4-hydroxybenzoate polyprenyltransferase
MGLVTTTADRSATPATALYVDLDGTLIASDMLWESVCCLAAQEPIALFRLPGWLLSGRAVLKRELAKRVRPDATVLPYRPEVLDYIRSARDNGRRVVLATASDALCAREIADHLELFDAVLASDGDENVKGSAKLAAIRREIGDAPFEYVGDSSADLAVWAGASEATLVAPSSSTAQRAADLGIPLRTLTERRPVLRAALKGIRPYQWVKNALLFLPILLAHNVALPERWLGVLFAFASFCCVASATYLLNDLLDIEADRRHPRKCRRPFAAGTLPIPVGWALIAGLLALGFGSSLALLPLASTGMLFIYLVLTTSYSLYFKQQLFLDVLILAGLYAHRVLAGGVAADVPVSPWLLAFSLFFFLSLAFVKRYAELLGAQADQKDRLERRGYETGDIGLVENMGTTSGYMSVLVVCLYLNSEAVALLYPRAGLLWLVLPFMLFWVTRIWFLARRGTMADDPVLFAATDPVTYLVGAGVAVVGVLAALAP